MCLQVVVEEDPAVHRRASEMAAEWGLDRRLVPQLDRQGVRRFFAVQCRVLPYLISTNRADLVRDVVVSAPTGSGKTLVYVMALLQVGTHQLQTGSDSRACAGCLPSASCCTACHLC